MYNMSLLEDQGPLRSTFQDQGLECNIYITLNSLRLILTVRKTQAMYKSPAQNMVLINNLSNQKVSIYASRELNRFAVN
jgi:hypothetical protein